MVYISRAMDYVKVKACKGEVLVWETNISVAYDVIVYARRMLIGVIGRINCKEGCPYAIRCK